MHVDQSAVSCGIADLTDLSEMPKPNLKRVYEEAYDEDWDEWNFAMVMFSDTSMRGRGRRLAKFIRDNKLGSVTTSPTVKNPNTNNMITAWIWRVDWPAMKKMFR